MHQALRYPDRLQFVAARRALLEMSLEFRDLLGFQLLIRIGRQQFSRFLVAQPFLSTQKLKHHRSSL
jgi:hypothetical protein